MGNRMHSNIESDIILIMAKAAKDVQVNFRVSERDLAYIDLKAKRYGMSRSALLKYLALNGEFTISMQEQLRKPDF